jgi:hypothetical protein
LLILVMVLAYLPLLAHSAQAALYTGANTRDGRTGSLPPERVRYAPPPPDLWVTNTNDSGPGSLRQAIIDALQIAPVSRQGQIDYPANTPHQLAARPQHNRKKASQTKHPFHLKASSQHAHQRPDDGAAAPAHKLRLAGQISKTGQIGGIY